MALQEHGAGLTHPVALSKGLICLGQLGPTSAVPLLHFSSAFPSEHCVMGLFPLTVHPNAGWQLSGVTGALLGAGITWQLDGSPALGDKAGQ